MWNGFHHRQSVRKVILPDSPPPIHPEKEVLSQHELTALETELIHQKTELNAAKAEIETLVMAIHQKDQNIITAQETISRFV